MNTRPWQDINLPFNPFEANREKQDAADRKKQEQDQDKADAESERDAYNKKFKPELSDPAWSHASESRAGESPDSALVGDTLLLSAKSKDIVAGAAVRCFIRDFAASAPWLTERKLSARVGNDDSVQVEWVIDKNKDDTENPEFKFWFETRKADSTVEASTAQTPIPLGKAQIIEYIEIPDILYNSGSALPLPGESWQLASILASAAAHSKEVAGSSLLVCGHASDSDKGICSTLDISKWRSVAIKALLDNEVDAWLDVAHDFSCSKDIQQFLVAVSSLWGDDCHPGDIDGVIGPKSKAAIRNYKKYFNKNAKGNLADSEAIDDAFLQSMVTLYRDVVLDQYKQSTGETSLPGVTWAHDGKGIFACGTSFKPEEGATSKSGARVELFFITDTVKAVITDPSDPESPLSSAEISIYGTGFNRTLIAPAEGSLSKRMSVDFIEIADIHFNHNCALPCLDSKGELIGLLAQAFEYAKKYPDRECIVEGHADTSGDPDYNLAISKRRGEAVKALLSNEISLWNGVVDANGSNHKIETEDYQATLKGLAEKYSWPCDPGAVDNKNGPKTEAAVKGFQTEYNKRFSKDLKVDGSVGPKTWEAIGLTIRSLLEDHLKNNLKLDPIPKITYGYPDGNGIYPCGESCPIENAGDSDYKSAENRRVELVFYKKGDPAPVVTPVAGRKVGIEKDPVSEKEWGKKGIKISPTPPNEKITLKLLHPKTTPHKQYVNLIQNDEDQGPELKFIADLKGAADGKIVIFEATVGNNNSKRDNPKTGLKDAAGKIIEFAAKKSKIEVKTKGGKAECVLSCGLAGGDEFTVEVSADGLKEKAAITNWRKIWYQKTYHKDSTVPSMATPESKLKEVCIEFIAEPNVTHSEGSAGKAIIGNHNAKTFHKMLKSTHTDQCVNLIFCDKQYDGFDSSGNDVVTSKSSDLSSKSETIKVGDSKDAKIALFNPPIQKASKFLLMGTWANKSDGKHGNLTDDPKKTNDDTGLITLLNELEVKVDLPKNADPSNKKPVSVALKVTAASGPWGGDGGTPPNNLIVIKKDDTLHSMCVMHELGHLINMVPLKNYYKCPPGFSLTDHKYSYSGMGGSGSHCSYGHNKSKSTAKRYVEGKCIMFHQLTLTCTLSYCDSCSPFVKAQTIKKFNDLK
jgi:peptidoglycan hydrolase-like protein with peptidoglycan-binding domain